MKSGQLVSITVGWLGVIGYILLAIGGALRQWGDLVDGSGDEGYAAAARRSLRYSVPSGLVLGAAIAIFGILNGMLPAVMVGLALGAAAWNVVAYAGLSMRWVDLAAKRRRSLEHSRG